MTYLRRLWQRAMQPRRCPLCGQPWRRRDDWLLHVGLDHPVEAEYALGRLAPAAWARYLENKKVAGSPQE
jgi:hypothetical protein